MKISILTETRVTIPSNVDIAYEMAFLDVLNALEALLLYDLLAECFVSWCVVTRNPSRLPLDL